VVFFPFDPDAQAFEDQGLAFSTEELSQCGGFVDLACVGKVFGAIL
jgi:hypothetical protein